MTWNFKSFTRCILLVSAFQVSAMFFVTTWPFPKLSKCPDDAQLDVQKKEMYFCIWPSLLFQAHTDKNSISAKDSTLFLSWSHVKVQKHSKVHLIPGISSLNMGLLSHSHISIFLWSYPPIQVPLHPSLFQSLWSLQGPLWDAWKIFSLQSAGNLLPGASTHLKTFFWSVYHPNWRI